MDPLDFKFVDNLRPPCSKCGRPLILTRIEPEEPGFDLRTLQAGQGAPGAPHEQACGPWDENGSTVRSLVEAVLALAGRSPQAGAIAADLDA
jgi:hypothetical protein